MMAAFSSNEGQHAQLPFCLPNHRATLFYHIFNKYKTEGRTHLSATRIKILRGSLSGRRKLFYGAMIQSPFRITPHLFLPSYR